ncbi:AAA family ATPase [Photobacterium gaetbulicola]|uniref:AAA family ATPase n=1 Tax=Photobacterium gaetbulicola TaxID=1295392 RepID=UPI00068D9B85|nr:AAA family ATPase [Photobacterium gaetbulicola]
MSIIENAFEKDGPNTTGKKVGKKPVNRLRVSSHTESSLSDKLASYQDRLAQKEKVAERKQAHIAPEHREPLKVENPDVTLEQPEKISSTEQANVHETAVDEVANHRKETGKTTLSSVFNRGVSLLKRAKPQQAESLKTSQGNKRNIPSSPHHVRGDKHVSDGMMFIDLELFKNKGMVSHEDDLANPVITYEYRLIKQKILNNIQQLSQDKSPNSNLLMVTSVNPSEGKTFCAINMALSIASEKNHTILLVDANTHNPSLCKELGVENKIGMIDYLLGNVKDIGDVIYNTNIPNLKILPAGTEHHLSNELLSSVKMHNLAEELSHRYSDRVIIFDCPSLLGVVETVTISQWIGQAVIVVEHSITKLSDIEQGISELNEDLKIGFIVNKTISGTYSRYGYGYEKKISST